MNILETTCSTYFVEKKNCISSKIERIIYLLILSIR